MSAKLLYSLSDDKKQIKNQSQMGCMNVLFHLFDRHHFMGGLRFNHKRLSPPGDSKQTPMENASFKAASATPSMLHAEYSQSPKLTRGSDHLRDIVKESINGEVAGLLVKTPVAKGVRNVVKHIDSPRPSLPSTPIKPKSSGLEESFKKLRKFQEIHNEGKDRSLLKPQKEGHRFSCDGRVTNSQDTLNSTLKLKEQPRLSLDSRASSTRRRLENDNYTSQKLEKPSSCNHTSIVAKLMGLDLTDSKVVTGESNETEQTVATGFHKHHIKNTIQLGNRDTIMKPTSASRLLVEPGPWKDASSVLRKPGFGEASKNVIKLMPSVYGEMEKRVTELEFTKSSSDLRALKQILGAMQKCKNSLQIQKELESDSVSQSSNQPILCSRHYQGLKSADSLTLPGSFSQSTKTGRGVHQKKRASPVPSKKPAHVVRHQQTKLSSEHTAEGYSGLRKLRTNDVCGQSKESTEKHTPSSPTLRTDNNNTTSPRTARLRNSKLTQPQAAEKNNATQSSGVVSPRLQQRQLRFDKKVQQTCLPSESTKMKMQPTDADSPAKRIQLASCMQKHGGKLADVSIKPSSGIQRDYSSRSDSSMSQSSLFVTDETEASFFWKRDIKQESKSARLDKWRAIPEINIISPEQPSPVSILDAMFYQDESPSPVKKISNIFIDDESFNQEEQMWTTNHGTSDNTTSSTSTDYDTEKLYNGEEQVDCYSTTFGNSTDCSLPLGDVKSQDHEYIFEVLLALGLFQEPQRGLETPHQSGYAVRPGIFKILEMKNIEQDPLVNMLNNDTVSKESVIERKLIFDIVNEILSSKLLQSYNNNELLTTRVADKSQAKKKLLKDICLEINQLQVKQSNCDNDDDCYDKCLKSMMVDDMQKHGPNGTEFHGEISALVLDVERLIFKDLISEIIIDAAEGPRTKYNGHCRQLFCK